MTAMSWKLGEGSTERSFTKVYIVEVAWSLSLECKQTTLFSNSNRQQTLRARISSLIRALWFYRFSQEHQMSYMLSWLQGNFENAHLDWWSQYIAVSARQKKFIMMSHITCQFVWVQKHVKLDFRCVNVMYKWQVVCVATAPECRCAHRGANIVKTAFIRFHATVLRLVDFLNLLIIVNRQCQFLQLSQTPFPIP